ncbi:MAG: molybdenum cofactor synthesis protein [Planctomycetes bacterium]|nr:molybdenum cofactor synthesis protein [Planctomycetota bacterium]
MAKVVSVNMSEEKGTVKRPVSKITVGPEGIEGDAHAGAWHRQVSLLGQESIDAFSGSSDRSFQWGEFAENLTTQGIDLVTCGIRDRLKIGAVELEVSQIGKKCHGDGCAIFREVGACVMPKQGIFAKVIQGGQIQAGDEIRHVPVPLKIRLITLSDRASAGVYEDRSGPCVETLLAEHFAQSHWNAHVSRVVIPDDVDQLRDLLTQAIETSVDVVMTLGSTGVGPRDIAPDVVGSVCDKTMPGVMEYIRMKYGEAIPSARLSRSMAGVAGETQIYTLPGSVRAVTQYTEEILKTIEHTAQMIRGEDIH